MNGTKMMNIAVRFVLYVHGQLQNSGQLVVGVGNGVIGESEPQLMQEQSMLVSERPPDQLADNRSH